MGSFLEFSLPLHSDERGMLVPVELNDQFPFPVRRVYFLQNIPPGETRGAHCHLIEKEVFVCIHGTCRALVDSDGKGKKDVFLDRPEKAIFVGTEVWHEFDSFSEDAVLLAFSSTHYLPGPENYLSDYGAFQKLIFGS